MHYQFPSELGIGPIMELFRAIPVSRTSRITVVTTPSVHKIPEVMNALDYMETRVNLAVYHIGRDAPIGEIDAIVKDGSIPETIVAIGGGSAIDAGKALSVAYGTSSITDLLYHRGTLPDYSVRTVAIPTTAGTGAEVSEGAIVYDEEEAFKGGIRGKVLRPRRVWLDTSLHAYAPKEIIQEAAFDCLTHALETYCATASNSVTKYHSVWALRSVFQHIEPAAKSKNAQSLQKLAIAATFMGANLVHSRTCLPHRVQYLIGPLTRTSHAKGLMMLYRGWLPLIRKEAVFTEIANELDMSSDDLVDRISGLVEVFTNHSSLKDFGVIQSDVSSLSSRVTGSMEVDPSFRNTETIERMIEGAI